MALWGGGGGGGGEEWEGEIAFLPANIFIALEHHLEDSALAQCMLYQPYAASFHWRYCGTEGAPRFWWRSRRSEASFYDHLGLVLEDSYIMASRPGCSEVVRQQARLTESTFKETVAWYVFFYHIIVSKI
jgi:hypothetical protein